MNVRSRPLAAAVCLAAALPLATPAAAAPPAARPGPSAPSYRTVLERVAGMVDDERALSFAQVRGLDIVNVTWEDTGRYYGSSVGPNISDMTIQVQHEVGASGRTRTETWLMPVIRHPNFSDKTGDVPIDQLRLVVGNARGEALRTVTLREVLADVRAYLSEPGSWQGEGKSLLAPRDSHVLVSAQAAFLPIPQGGEATFNPVLFNYQSERKNPAVLTILATREGTSITVIDNARDGFDAGGAWGQRLFFNSDGQRASLTGKRESESPVAAAATPGATASVGGNAGLNMVMLIQVPLKQRPRRRSDKPMASMMGAAAGDAGVATRRGGSDVENAVIGHGDLDGPFVEIDDLAIERDPRFPIRATVQFYKATSNGVVSRADIVAIQSQIKRVYKDADYVGSLVTEGFTGRPTEWEGDHREPAWFWEDFWQRYEAESGWTRIEAMGFLSALLPHMVAWRRTTMPDDVPWSSPREPVSEQPIGSFE